MKPVAWRWTNQFGKDVLSSNRELAKLMEDKGLHVEPLYTSRWEDKREQQPANAGDSAPSACTTVSTVRPIPERDRSEADKQDIWDAWSVVDAFGRKTMLDSTDGHAAIVHAIRYGRYGAKPTRIGFERLLESIRYDGGDINSLTVGEIRRAI